MQFAFFWCRLSYSLQAVEVLDMLDILGFRIAAGS